MKKQQQPLQTHTKQDIKHPKNPSHPQNNSTNKPLKLTIASKIPINTCIINK